MRNIFQRSPLSSSCLGVNSPSASPGLPKADPHPLCALERCTPEPRDSNKRKSETIWRVLLFVTAVVLAESGAPLLNPHLPQQRYPGHERVSAMGELTDPILGAQRPPSIITYS